MRVALLHDLHQVAERLRMNKENCGSARSAAWSSVDQVESACLHVLESFVNVSDPKREVSKSATAPVSFQLLRHRRFGTERLKQLDQVRAVTHTQKDFPYLVRAEHLLAVNLLES